MIGFDCRDCGVDTSQTDGISEYYMVNDDLWESAISTSGMLCIGCLERRIGRRLTAADFTDCPLNSGLHWRQSVRLRNRLGPRLIPKRSKP
jgi:hypothetical protein